MHSLTHIHNRIRIRIPIPIRMCALRTILRRQKAKLLNATGKPILVENCFDNASFPFTASGVDDGTEAVEEEACPMNLFRAGGDMRAQWPLMLRRLQTVVPWLRLSRPKCWAYLDMLEVGNPPGGTGEQPSFENVHSWRAHFGAWASLSDNAVTPHPSCRESAREH